MTTQSEAILENNLIQQLVARVSVQMIEMAEACEIPLSEIKKLKKNSLV